MITFGLIAEGATDMTVLENILIGYFDDVEEDKIEVTFLQPSVDETSFGGWYNALEYCKSDDFRDAFNFLDYLIIQVDTDICQEIDIAIIGENEKDKLPKFLEKIHTKIITEYIGKDFFERHQERIIFALSVHSIECWLLPLYCSDKKREKMLNCLTALNRELSKSKKTSRFIINATNKNARKYERLSAPFRKQKALKKHHLQNPSFQIFIENLEYKFHNFS